MSCLRREDARLSLQADGVHATRRVPGGDRAGAAAQDPRQPHHHGTEVDFGELPRARAKTVRGGRARVRAQDDGRQASRRDPEGHRAVGVRPHRPRSAGHRPGARQPDRLGLRAGRARGRKGRLGRQAPPREGRGRTEQHSRRHRRQPAILRRLDDRHRPGREVRQDRRSRRGLRSLSSLLGLQRCGGRADREGGQGVPLRGAEPAARGDHRLRSGPDLPVPPGCGAHHGRGPGRGAQAHAARRQGIPEGAGPPAQDEAVAAGDRPDRCAQRQGRARTGQ